LSPVAFAVLLILWSLAIGHRFFSSSFPHAPFIVCHPSFMVLIMTPNRRNII